LCVAKGTLVPAKSLRCGQPQACPALRLPVTPAPYTHPALPLSPSAPPPPPWTPTTPRPHPHPHLLSHLHPHQASAKRRKVQPVGVPGLFASGMHTGMPPQAQLRARRADPQAFLPLFQVRLPCSHTAAPAHLRPSPPLHDACSWHASTPPLNRLWPPPRPRTAPAPLLHQTPPQPCRGCRRHGRRGPLLSRARRVLRWRLGCIVGCSM